VQGEGRSGALHLLTDHPDLVDAVICPSGSPVVRVAGAGTDSFAGSRSVFDLLNEMAVRDYRGFLHSIVASTNPQLDEASVSVRVAAVVGHTPHEVMLARLQAWLRDDGVEISLAAGDRLTILLYGADPWSSPDAAQPRASCCPRLRSSRSRTGRSHVPTSRPRS